MPSLKTPDDPAYVLPTGFKYKPYIPKKRVITKMTSKGSFTQRSNPLFLHGEETIEWSIDLVTRPVAKALDDLYNYNGYLEFEGYYNEKYLVEMMEWEPDPIAGYFAAKGTFRIVCVLTPANLNPNC